MRAVRLHAPARRISDLPDFRIGVREQQNENLELLVRAGRERPLRGQQPNVARYLASLEEIENRRVSTHGVAT